MNLIVFILIGCASTNISNNYFVIGDEVTSNADGGKSVRFPVHKCIKPIGTEPNN